MATVAWLRTRRDPRWASYYLEVPAFTLDESLLDSGASADLVLVRLDRAPGCLPDAAVRAPVAAGDAYTVLDGAMMVE